MTNHLPEAFQSPALGWLTVGYFLSACVETYFKRIEQFKKSGSLPPEAESAPTWLFFLFTAGEYGAKIALVVLNWQFGLVLYAIWFTLAWVGVLEEVGRILMHPFLRTPLPGFSFDDLNPQQQVWMLPAHKRFFASKLLWIVAWYVGISLLLSHFVRGHDPAAPFLWGLSILRVFLYLYIFIFSWYRMVDCRSWLCWLAIPIAVLGRINDYELVAIPSVAVIALIISAGQKPPELPPAAVEPVRDLAGSDWPQTL